VKIACCDASALLRLEMENPFETETADPNIKIYRPIRAFTKMTAKRLKTKAIGR
jgi:hypothetical protein